MHARCLINRQAGGEGVRLFGVSTAHWLPGWLPIPTVSFDVVRQHDDGPGPFSSFVCGA